MKRTCGLDIGRRRVGVAIDDELGLMAHPRGVLEGRDPQRLLWALQALTVQEQIGRFVVGLPLDMRGGEGEAARGVRSLATRIAEATQREVFLWDERLTSVQARRLLREGEVRGLKANRHVDEAAAVILLQSWIDAQPRNSRQEEE